MKQFNLGEYLTNPNRKIVTRDGRDARIICTDKLSEEYPVVALWHCVNEKGKTLEEIETYTRCGQAVIDSEDGCDLFFAPEKKEGWINIYRVDDFKCNATDKYIYRREIDAISAIAGNKDYITTVKIEWEE